MTTIHYNNSIVKLGRCFTFLKDYYGIVNGGDRKSEKIKSANGVLEITQQELAAGIEVISIQVSKPTMLDLILPKRNYLLKSAEVTE